MNIESVDAGACLYFPLNLSVRKGMRNHWSPQSLKSLSARLSCKSLGFPQENTVCSYLHSGKPASTFFSYTRTWPNARRMECDIGKQHARGVRDTWCGYKSTRIIAKKNYDRFSVSGNWSLRCLIFSLLCFRNIVQLSGYTKSRGWGERARSAHTIFCSHS